jgi:hypothetical protein
MEGLTEFINAMNGVPAAAYVELAGRAVNRRRGLKALVGGAPTVCTAHYKLRFRRHDYEGTILSYTQSLHLIGKVGSVRHPRMAALEASSSECYE